MPNIRSPILTLLGHVDHGKTSLLDRIRGTTIAKAEPGLITQYISASYVPIDVIKNVSGPLLEKLKIDITIPGLLWIDSPGHEAFTTLRKRGGAIADLAVLVVDINEGFKPQTEESLNYLKQFKTPFVVAATKIDKMMGWNPKENSSFMISYNDQSDRVQNDLEEKLYKIIGELGSRGFEAERYDRVSDHTKQVCIVPVSSMTGEGIPDLLMIITGIAQRFLKDRLELQEGEGKGTVLEVKDFKGLGTTIDVVLYDGEIKKGDHIVIGGAEIVKTKAKALMEPEALKELRIDKGFKTVNEVHAAAGIKIAAPTLEKVIAGSPLRAVSNEKFLKKAEEEIKAEVSEVVFDSDKEGVLLKADTLGSLEALLKTLKEKNIPIRKAHVGSLTKSEVMEMKCLNDPIILSFGVKVPADIMQLAKDNCIAVFYSDVIYKLLEDYEKWSSEKKEREETKCLACVARPAIVKSLPGYVFRQSKPAVFGVEVMKGVIRTGVKLRNEEGKTIGTIKDIQAEGEHKDEAEAGERVALSVEDATIGKNVKEGDILHALVTKKDIEVLNRLKYRLRGDEKELLEELIIK